MKPARFVLSLVGVALFLAIFTAIVVLAVAEASGTQIVNWGTTAGGVLGAVLLAVLVIRAGLLWSDNRKEKAMSSYEAGRQLGYAAFPVILLAITAYVGWRMGRKREPQKFVWWPVAVAAVLLALSALGLQLKKQREAAYYSSETR